MFSCFILKLYSLQNNENKKTLNYHRFLIEVDCSLVIKHNSKLNGVQTIQMSQVFVALLCLSEPSFEDSIAEEWLLI
jgi:hypothetical protein